MDEKLTLEEALEIVKKFRGLIKEVDYYINLCSDEIITADKAFGDVRHFIELSPELDSMEENVMVQLIRNYSKSRRKAKDFKMVLEPLKELLVSNPKLDTEMGRVTNEMERKYKEITGARAYRYRVLDDELTALRREPLSNMDNECR